MEMQQCILCLLEKINIPKFISRLTWDFIVCPHPRTTWPCCWRSTTERGYTWLPMRWRGAWTTRSPCRTSTAGWSRSTWSTGWRRASSAASLLSRLVVPRCGSVGPSLLLWWEGSINWFWADPPPIPPPRTDSDMSLTSVSSRRRRASPSASQTWRLWPRAPRFRPQPKAPPRPSWLFLDATLFIFLYRINYFLLKGCLCVYSIYTSAKGKIKAPLIHPQLCMCVFLT